MTTTQTPATAAAPANMIPPGVYHAQPLKETWVELVEKSNEDASDQCSIAVRMMVMSSVSRTIVPETACDTLITVARSSCSTDVPIVFVGLVAGFSLPSWGYISSSCRTFPSAAQRR